MSQDKELIIQMQFLEEATDYLNTLETVLLEINSSNRIELEKINAALRAAHSIKGGAGMMGFRELSNLAHRLEDCFKVLKTQKNSLHLDTELQSLLLSGVDWLRQIVGLHSEGNIIDEQWLANSCYPVFAQLHQRLGDPTPEDATTILSPEEGQDIVPLLFETEVEGSLQRLEAMLADISQPSLREEVNIMAMELGGLGEMLQLEAFAQLCQSISDRLSTAPSSDDVAEIATAALAAWRRSQALVLTNQLDNLPRQISLDNITLPSTSTEATTTTQPTEISPENYLDADILTMNFQALEAAFANENMATASSALSAAQPLNLEEFNHTDYQSREPKTEPIAANHRSEIGENTVRVPSKELEQINDLFGELIIQRNGLNLQLERLRKLMGNLSQRVQTLERENQKLRTGYDKIATHNLHPAGVSPPAIATDRQPDSPQLEFADNESLEGMNVGFDALEMDRYNELSLLSQDVMETIVQVQEVSTDLQISLDDTDKISRKFNKTSKQLQSKLTRVRMRPLSDLVNRFPRALRDLSVEYGKNVQLQVEGANTLIERSILEALTDPLMHLLRNAFDHGIETPDIRRSRGKTDQGLITIQASQQNNRIVIKISDDGQGISLDKIRHRAIAMGLDDSLIGNASDEELLSLIFEPGFSTCDQVTTLSGRGVGMDVVRNNLQQVRGDVKVDTELGHGTTFTLSVPFTLSVARVLLVENNRMLLAFSTDVVEEMFLLQKELIFPMANREMLNYKGNMLPLIRLEQYLKFNCPQYDHYELETPAAINATSVLIINTGNQLAAVVVERCWGEQEVAIRHVEGNIPLPKGFSNCTILGDGRVVPLVNINELLYWIANHEGTPKNNQSQSARLKTVFLKPADNQPVEIPIKNKGSILIIDDSINVRRFLALTLEKGGYQVEQAKDGQDALEKLENGLRVQAVICDIEMPRIDGYGFLGRVKSNKDLKNIPVAMLTSRSSEKHRQLAMQLGAQAYFSKPYNEQELLRTLEGIMVSVN
ncbi:MAG: hybrid sensor histidine kinase/response regulator [Calothrix sp. MO_167.B12]|nr:hybrid sensor histidine kinase/response regulator [Calothrix sp. MO_167.B12]